MSFGIEGQISLLIFVIVNALYFWLGQSALAGYALMLAVVYTGIVVFFVGRAVWCRERPDLKRIYLCFLFAGAYVITDFCWHNYYEAQKASEMLAGYF